MKLDINNIDIDNFNLDSNGIVILPCNYIDTDNHEYHSTAISFYKYASKKVNIEYLTAPEVLIDQRSGDWFGPLLLITSTAVTQNPELISITCGVISSYLTDFFQGKGEKNIRLKLIYKEVDDMKITEFSYEGSLDGLPYLENSIKNILDKGLSNE
ncbi:hypothetical protein [Aeromonas dhakensis]|uniref:hypothetical protein n=1 Tax=Aeromonas dhakensis TaxID=196024 RepID=UPI001F60A73D|nr:hypothetical protein [Aeromonas dhakensis]UNU87488.1 hypothetical protein GB930_04455 [Aeromonas dhakensis]